MTGSVTAGRCSWTSGCHKADIALANSPSFERYLNTPMDVPVDPLRTELYIPLV